MNADPKYTQIEGVAVVGMAGRFPDAPGTEQLWRNLCGGVESVTEFTDAQLLSAGVDAETLQAPNYVKSGVLLGDVEMFDAKFFGYTPREAELMDPQQRVFLECAWEALEKAGRLGDRNRERAGVFAGAGPNQYLSNNLAQIRGLLPSLDLLQKMISSDKDFLSTRVSYKLDLTGPSITVQTACSTSLVAVHLACQSLLAGDCDVALAGGVFLRIPQVAGYLHRQGGIPSPDGHCRAFDAEAQGTAIGSGAAIVVLRRLEDALRDGDTVHAVILGSAVNNDGAVKIGYTAPGVEGQEAVIAAAHAAAGVTADEISYVEAHGTGTSLGDPIEVSALTRAFRRTTKKNGYCALGSLKTNIGHLDAAAGCAGLIKTVLALEHRTLPPSLNCRLPNPTIDFATSPFFVQQTLSEWRPFGGRRVAGVSSFGIGGTNAHVIVEEAPPAAPAGPARPWQILPLSAKTPAALEQAAGRLRDHLAEHPEINLADAAYTLQLGRKSFPHRRVAVASSTDEAVRVLESKDSKRVFGGVASTRDAALTFLFPGQGTQYPGMGQGLYENEPVFRRHIDDCAARLRPALGLDLRELMYPAATDREAAAARLRQTRVAQPAVFTLEYALARQWMSWGVTPSAMAGHSLGEYVAAALAGVFDLEDALALVAERARLMQELPGGAMLAVRFSERDLAPWLEDGIALAAVNAPGLSVASGPADSIERLAARLRAEHVESQRLQTSHAFHSAMIEPMIAPFVAAVARTRRRAPQIPFLSCMTGTWITDEQATDPQYWGAQTRHAVRFGDAVAELLKTEGRVFLEVGPGHTLTTLTRLQSPQALAVPSLPHAGEDRADLECMLAALGRLWAAGCPVEWPALHDGERRRRVPLPTYPFQRERYWIQPHEQPDTAAPSPSAVSLPNEPGANAEAAAAPEALDLHSRPEGLASAYAAPTSDAEKSLARLWEHALGVKQVGIDDDFFDLGGHSLLALTILEEVEREFGRRLLLASLVDAKTIRMFVELLGAPRKRASLACVVALSTEGAKPPLFLMHSHGGNILEYVPLAHRLGAGRPVYAVQARGLSEGVPPDPRIEEMAAHYLKEIRIVQPHGPYHLGGFCFGGFLALEAAQQLRAQGEEVALLALLDSSTKAYPAYPAGTTRLHRLVYNARRRLLLEWSGLVSRPRGMRLAHAAARIRRLRDRLQSAAEGLVNWVRVQWRSGPPAYSVAHNLERLAAAHDRAWAAYSPKPYGGRVLFLRARQQPFGVQPDPMLGWSGLFTGEVRVRETPGFRQNMLDEPRAGQVAAAILEALEACETPVGAGGVKAPGDDHEAAPGPGAPYGLSVAV